MRTFGNVSTLFGSWHSPKSALPSWPRLHSAPSLVWRQTLCCHRKSEEDVLIDASEIKCLQTASLNMEGEVERSRNTLQSLTEARRLISSPRAKRRVSEEGRGMLEKELNIAWGENQDRGTDCNWAMPSLRCDWSPPWFLGGCELLWEEMPLQMTHMLYTVGV